MKAAPTPKAPQNRPKGIPVPVPISECYATEFKTEVLEKDGHKMVKLLFFSGNYAQIVNVPPDAAMKIADQITQAAERASSRVEVASAAQLAALGKPR